MVNLRVRQWRFRTQLLSVMTLLVAVPVVTLGVVVNLSRMAQELQGLVSQFHW